MVSSSRCFAERTCMWALNLASPPSMLPIPKVRIVPAHLDIKLYSTRSAFFSVSAMSAIAHTAWLVIDLALQLLVIDESNFFLVTPASVCMTSGT